MRLVRQSFSSTFVHTIATSHPDHHTNFKPTDYNSRINPQKILKEINRIRISWRNNAYSLEMKSSVPFFAVITYKLHSCMYSFANSCSASNTCKNLKIIWKGTEVLFSSQGLFDRRVNHIIMSVPKDSIDKSKGLSAVDM